MSRNGLVKLLAIVILATVLHAGCNRSTSLPSRENPATENQASENPASENQAPETDSRQPAAPQSLAQKPDSERSPSQGLLPRAAAPTKEPEIAPPQLIQSGVEPWISLTALPVEAWYSQYVAQSCIGVSRVSITPPATQGSNTIRITKRDVIETRTSDGATRVQVALLESLERPNGDLLSFTETISTGDSVTSEISGEFKINTFTLTTTANGTSTSNNITWPEGAWGPFGTMTMLRSPSQTGGHYQGQMLVPQLGKFIKVDLHRGKPELTTLPGGIATELVPVDTEFTHEQISAKTKNWLSESGQIMKTISPEGFTTFSISQAEAELIESEMRVAELLALKIAVKSPMSTFSKPQAIYQIEAEKRDPFMLFSRTGNQVVKSITARNAEVLVTATSGTERPGEEFKQDQPSSNCGASSKHVNLEHAATRTLADELAGSHTDPLAIASALTEGVFKRLEKTPLARKFVNSTAAVSATRGDCVTHAVLLTALLRTQGTPARLASGLRMVEQGNASEAILHTWVEAWLGDRWLPLDPYLGTTGVGTDHLKFLESDLSGENPYDAILPVLQVLPQLSIAVKVD